MTEKPSRLGSGAMWSMLDNLAQQVLSFLVFMVLARFIAPQEFGLIAIAHVIITLVRQTVFDPLVYPVARTQSPSDDLYSFALSACMLAALLMAALMLSGAGLIARFYANPALVQVLSWMSLVVLMTGLASVFEVRLIRKMEFRPLAIRSIISVVFGGTVGIVLALRGAGVMALVTQQLVTSCTALTLLFVQSHWKPRIGWKNIPVRDFLPESSRVSMTGLFAFLTSQGDTLLVSVLLGSYATGIYSFAKRLTSAIYLVIGSSLLKLAINAFAEAGAKPEALRDAYLRILGTSIFLMAPLLAGMSVLAKPMIGVFFGAVWLPAAPIVALLSLLYLLLAANQINDNFLFAVGARSTPVHRGLIQTLLSIILGWVASRFGLEWTALGFVLAGSAVWPWVQTIANKHMNFGFLQLAAALKAPLLATAAMTLVLWIIPHSSPASVPKLGGLVAAGAVVYLLSYLLLIRLSPSSHDALKDLLHRRRAAPR